MGIIDLPYKLVLGSQSPRRKELIEKLDLPFSIRIPDIDESFPKEMEKSDVAAYIANLKLTHLLKKAEVDELIICSDTVVLIQNEILEKPKNFNDAKQMLQKLSGNTHHVLTSVSMGTQTNQSTFTDCTEVTFNLLNEKEIEYYIENYKPYDKAGSYGVQDWIGMVAIKEIKGSFYTVMGLPIHLVYQKLQSWPQ